MKSIFDILAKPADVDELRDGVPLVEYLNGPEMSGSSLKEKSLKHIRHYYENNSVATDPMRKGAATDALLFDYLIPARQAGRSLQDAIDEFDADWPLFTGTQRRGNAWKDFEDEHGRQYLLQKERPDIVGMLHAIVTDPLAAPYWNSGVPQTSMRVTESGLRFKGRTDWLSTNIVDLKTTADISPNAIGRTTFRLKYNLKMALYRRWIDRLVGGGLRGCVLIFVESSAPYDVAVVPVPAVVLGLAEEQALLTIDRLKRAIDTNSWPGVSAGKEVLLEIPSHEMSEVEWAEMD